MTEYPYDPELPYVVARIKEKEPSYPVGIIARFKKWEDAQDMEDNFQPGWVELVDTTPAPKIPADAEFIFWVDFKWESPWYGRRLNSGNWELDDGDVLDEEDLVKKIGDAEVVVLKRA